MKREENIERIKYWMKEASDFAQEAELIATGMEDRELEDNIKFIRQIMEDFSNRIK